MKKMMDGVTGARIFTSETARDGPTVSYSSNGAALICVTASPSTIP